MGGEFPTVPSTGLRSPCGGARQPRVVIGVTVVGTGRAQLGDMNRRPGLSPNDIRAVLAVEDAAQVDAMAADLAGQASLGPPDTPKCGQELCLVFP